MPSCAPGRVAWERSRCNLTGDCPRRALTWWLAARFSTLWCRLPPSTRLGHVYQVRRKRRIRCACARTRVPDSPSTDLVVDSGSTWTRWEVVRTRTRHDGDRDDHRTIEWCGRWTEGKWSICILCTGDSGAIARVRSTEMQELQASDGISLLGRDADITVGWIPDTTWIRSRIACGSRATHARGKMHGVREHGVLGRLLRRDRSSTGLAPSFVFRCWLPRASTGRLRVARSADRRRLCVRSLSLFLTPSLSQLLSVCLSDNSNAALLRESDALPVAVRQQLDRRNRRRWRPAGVSSQKWLSPIAPSLRDARVHQVCLFPSRRLAECPRNPPPPVSHSLSLSLQRRRTFLPSSPLFS